MAKTAAGNQDKTAGAMRAQTSRIRALMKSLPADVQAEIEKHCSENNNGERAASHSRAAMTERALAYQDKMGKRPGTGCNCPECITRDRPSIASQEQAAGPLDVYSAERWARLQAKGYYWDPVLHRARRGRDNGSKVPQIAPPVPGDPAYRGVAS